MDLFEESILQNEKSKDVKAKKTARLILILILVLLILTMGLGIAIVYLKQDTLVAYVDGNANANVRDMLIIDESTSQIYAPIKDIATYLGYTSYNGSYSNMSESASECYVKCDNEVAEFALNSNVLYKIMPDKSSDYEYFYIDEPVIARNGKLYTTIDGLKKAFNVDFTYDVASKKIYIYTMPYLINFYSSKVLDYGYSAISEDFNNQKTVLENMLVVNISNANSSNQSWGVISASTGEAILEAKYQSVEYLQHTSDFLVKNNNQVGIIGSNKATKVQLIYDSIELMDYENNLYKVSKDKKVGMIDNKGNIKLYLDYDAIGIDVGTFKANDIKSGYILLNNLIPVQKDKKWGLFDLNGKQIVDFNYDQFGYISSTTNITNNLLIIPEYEEIVVKQGEKYSLITTTGVELFPFLLNDIYQQTSGGKIYYYMTWNDKTLDVTEQLNELGYKKKTTTTTNSNQNTATENTTTQNSTIENEIVENSITQ